MKLQIIPPSQQFLEREKRIKLVAKEVNQELGVRKEPLQNNNCMCIVHTEVAGCKYFIQGDGRWFTLNGLRENAHVFRNKTEATSATYHFDKSYRFTIQSI